MKTVTRALRHCLYINHLSQFARAIQIFGRLWICFKNILSLTGPSLERVPAEIWQRVQGTRPDKGEILVISKKSTPKLKVNHLSKINSIE